MNENPDTKYSSKAFTNDLILGIVVLVLIFLPWKLMEMTKMTLIFGAVQRKMDEIGFPPILGHIVTVVISLGVLAGIGYTMRRFVRQRLNRFPMISGLLDSGENIAKTFSSDSNNRVVIVDWPTEDVRALAILTAETECPNTGEKLAVIFIPNTPNPAAGMTRIVHPSKLTMTDMKASRLLGLSLSRGATAPKHLELERMVPRITPDADIAGTDPKLEK